MLPSLATLMRRGEVGLGEGRSVTSYQTASGSMPFNFPPSGFTFFVVVVFDLYQSDATGTPIVRVEGPSRRMEMISAEVS